MKQRKHLVKLMVKTKQKFPVNFHDSEVFQGARLFLQIWVPDTYFPDSLQASRQDVMVPNVLIRLSPDGNILYSSRVTVITKCPMELGAFPLDAQTCFLRLECYGYTAEELKLFWYKDQDSGMFKIPLDEFKCIYCKFLRILARKYEVSKIRAEKIIFCYC